MMNNLTLQSPLEIAVSQGRADVVSFLLSTGIQPAPAALTTALQMDDIPMIELLLPHCSPADFPENPLENTASIIAVKLLVEHGFPVDQRNSGGQLPHEVNPNPEAAAVLRAAWQVLQPPPALPDAGYRSGDLEFTNSQVGIQELHMVNYSPASGSFEIEYCGETYVAGKRFLNSLARKLKISSNVFSFFSGEEVLARAAERQPDLYFRVTFDHARHVILGVVDANKKILPPEIAYRIFAEDPRTKAMKYNDGIITAEMMLNENFTIAGDSDYRRKLSLRYPVDGVSMPSIYLAVERQICSNGATALLNAFKTEIEVNDHSGTHLSRLISSFSNETGFSVLENRIAKAQETLASVRELMNIQNLLTTQIFNRSDFNHINEQLELLAGDPCSQYEITALNNVSVKRRPLLPVRCSVNDLINFCSELTTHHAAKLRNSDSFHAEIGKMLAQEFDLEDMYHNRREAKSFYIAEREEA